jgi:hypothetical protein
MAIRQGLIFRFLLIMRIKIYPSASALVMPFVVANSRLVFYERRYKTPKLTDQAEGVIPIKNYTDINSNDWQLHCYGNFTDRQKPIIRIEVLARACCGPR